jgi:hypothetical protein
MKTDNPKPSYQERSVQKFHETLAVQLAEAKKDFTAGKEALQQAEGGIITAANKFRAVGIRLQSACNHELVNLDFWNNNNCEAQLGFDFQTAKQCMAIARRLPKVVKSLDDAAPFVQLLFQAGDLLHLERRSEPQNRVTVSVMQKFLNEVTIIRRDFEKVERQIPMNDWSQTMLRSFVSDTKWIADKREMAVGLMERNGWK